MVAGNVLDDEQVTKQRDPSGALAVAADLWEQARFEATVWQGENDGRELYQVVLAGMGGSALAALVAKAWLSDMKIPFDIIRGYELPKYVGKNTLVIASSYSGNTAEVLSCLEQAERIGAQIAIISSGGKLLDEAASMQIAHVQLPPGIQPRMADIYNLRALARLLTHFGVVPAECFDEISHTAGWLKQASAAWVPSEPEERNYAKQLASKAVGKNAVFYGGELTAPIAYKWKISWNETAKNVAFWNQYPEIDHNEFMGWTAQPVEKPFAVFDIISSFERAEIRERFELTDQLLSGKRPAATTIELKGDSLLAQLLWGNVLAAYTSIYLALLNNVDPTPVNLIEELKREL